MYRQNKTKRETLTGIKAYVAESIEDKVARMKSNKEPIKDTAPLIYDEAGEGVMPDYDIRTDKYEYLVEGHSAIAKTKRATANNIGKAIDDLEKKNAELKNESPEKTE